MMVFLGDEITLLKGETSVTGQISGVVLDKNRDLERIYIHGIDQAFWISDKWQIAEEAEDEDGEI